MALTSIFRRKTSSTPLTVEEVEDAILKIVRTRLSNGKEYHSRE